MNLLIVGANGLLGSNTVSAGQQRDWNVCGTYHSARPNFDIPLSQFDLRDATAFEDILAQYEPDVVVNCAAMTDVDACEADRGQAHELNGEAPGVLATQCEDEGIKFVHISTDYVFDGTERDPYSESADTDPVQVYGESKLVGEQAVQDTTDTALIPRLSFVWGVHRSTGNLTGFPAWVRAQLQSGAEVPLFTDQWVTPTRAGQAAQTLLDLVEQNADGLFHVACDSCVTPFAFGELLAQYIEGETGSLVEGTMADVDREAMRPQYTCLTASKVESALGRSQPTLRDDVETVRETL